MTTAVVEARRDRVVEMTLAGTVADAIAARLGVSARTVNRDRVARGVTLPPAERCRGGRYTHGCRCDLCRERQALRQREYRSRRLKRAAPTVHGASTYTNHGCRCAVCTVEHANACRTRRDKRRRAAGLAVAPRVRVDPAGRCCGRCGIRFRGGRGTWCRDCIDVEAAAS